MDIEVLECIRKVGYDQGFENPKFESKDTYPDYIKENVTESIEKIKKHQKKECVTFAFMTDIHYLPLPHHDVLLERNKNAYRSICENVQCDKLILGGDYIIDTFKKDKLDGFIRLSKELSEFHYLPVHGNHDCSALWDKYLGNERVHNKLNKPQLFKAFYSHLPAEGAVFNKDQRGLYYYVDDEEKNIRYIMLDICDAPAQYDDSFGNPFCISQSQLDWFTKKALMTQKDILVFAHSIRRDVERKGEIVIHGEYLGVITQVLDAYKNGEKLEEHLYEDEFALNINVDFANMVRGDIAGIFAGHFHNDIVEYTKSGIPCVFTANFNMAECYISVPRVVGNKTEILFDIVTVDRQERVFYITRVGAGEDRIVKY